MASVTTLKHTSGFDLNQALAATNRGAASRLNGYDPQAAASYDTKVSGYAKISDSLEQLQSASGVIEKLSNFTVPKNGGQPATVSAVKLFVQAFNTAQRDVSDQLDVKKSSGSPGASKGMRP